MAKSTGKDDLTKLRKELGDLNNNELHAVYREIAGYEEVPVDIMTFVEDSDYLGNFFGDSQFFPCWVEPLKEIYPNPYISPCNEIILTGCFVGSTQVSLLDGRELSFKDLVDEYGDGTPFWVYSWSRKHTLQE